MKYLINIIGVVLVLCVVFVGDVFAIVDPRESDNNKVGIHISTMADVDAAAALVNSNGGDWGYVTVVIRDNDRDVEHWQEFFDQLREKRLIPIVRLATHAEGDNWVKPKESDVNAWVEFLSQLNWVVKNRYVVLFNETNHAKEWGGEIRPEEYAHIARVFQEGLKKASEDFFVLPAGMDDAAPDGSATMSSARYFKEMFAADNQVFDLFDGWTSHSYPNPDFSGKVTDVGPGTVRGFEAELRLVRQFGFDDNKPVFITETGWVHSEGSEKKSTYITPENVGENLLFGFENVWNSDNVVAVTPFILDYSQAPFDHFSWKKLNEDTFLAHYDMVRDMPKVAGSPDRNHDSEYVRTYLPSTLQSGEGYTFAVEFVNSGQSIWDSADFELRVDTSMPEGRVVADQLHSTKPGESAVVFIDLFTPYLDGTFELEFELVHGGDKFGDTGSVDVTLAKNLGVVDQFKLWLQQWRHADKFMISLVWPEKYESLRS